MRSARVRDVFRVAPPRDRARIARLRRTSSEWGTAVNAMIELLQITILLVAAVPLLAIVQPFMAPVEGIGIIIITIVLMIVVVTRSARQMQGQLRNATRLIASALRGAPAVAGSNSYEVPGIGMITPVPLRADSEGVGKKLSELDLHTTAVPWWLR